MPGSRSTKKSTSLFSLSSPLATLPKTATFTRPYLPATSLIELDFVNTSSSLVTPEALRLARYGAACFFSTLEISLSCAIAVGIEMVAISQAFS